MSVRKVSSGWPRRFPHRIATTAIIAFVAVIFSHDGRHSQTNAGPIPTLFDAHSPIRESTEDRLASAPRDDNGAILLKTAYLHRTLGTDARDRHHDAIAATHHFFRAAQLAKEANAHSASTHLLLAAQNQQDDLNRAFVHDDHVNGAQFISKGKRVLTWSDDGAVKIWELDTTLPTHTYPHDVGVNTATLNIDETKLLTWCDDGNACLWDVDREKSLRTFPMRSDRVSDLSLREDGGAIFSPDEKHVLTWSSTDQAIRIWAADTEEPLNVIEQSATNAAFLENDRFLVWNRYFGIPQQWKIGAEQPTKQYRQADRYVEGSAVNDEKTHIFAAGEADHDLPGDFSASQIWDLETGNLVREIPSDWYPEGVLSRDASKLLTWNSTNGLIRLWDQKHEQPLRTIETQHSVDGAAFSKNGRQFLTWTTDGMLQLWNQTQSRVLTHGRRISGATFNASEDQVIAWGEGVALWDVHEPWNWTSRDNPPKVQFDIDRSIAGAIFNADESQILSWGFRSARLWNVNPDPPLRIYRHETAVHGAAFNEDGTQFLTRSYKEEFDDDNYQPIYDKGSAVSLWSPDQERPIRVFSFDRWPASAEFHANDTRVSVRDEYEHALQLLATDRKKPLLKFPDDPAVFGPVFNFDESQFLVWTGTSVERKSSADGRTLAKFQHEEEVTSAEFNQAGNRILTASQNQAVLWDVTNNQSIHTFPHSAKVEIARFAEYDSDVLLTLAGKDVYLWSIAHQKKINSFHHDDEYEPKHVYLTQNGSRLITQSINRLTIWDTQKNKRIRQFETMALLGQVDFNSDHTHILSTWNGYQPVELWNIEQDKPLRTFPARDVISGNFLIEPHQLITWGNAPRGGSAINVWDIDQESPLHRVEYDAGITEAIRNADKSCVLFRTTDNTAHLWDIELDLELLRFSHDGNVNGACLNPQQTSVLTWSDDKTARLWTIEPNLGRIETQIRDYEIQSGIYLNELGQTKELSFAEWKERAANAVRPDEESD